MPSVVLYLKTQMKAGTNFLFCFRLNLRESQANHRETQPGRTLTSAINYSLTLHQRADCLMRSDTNCNTFCLSRHTHSCRRQSVRAHLRVCTLNETDLYVYIVLLIASTKGD